NPFGAMKRGEISSERRRFTQMAPRIEEAKSTGDERLFEMVQEQTTEQARQHAHRQKERGTARHPAHAARRDPAARNQTVQMRMMHQVLTPGVQHGEETNLRAEMVRIGGDPP